MKSVLVPTHPQQPAQLTAHVHKLNFYLNNLVRVSHEINAANLLLRLHLRQLHPVVASERLCVQLAICENSIIRRHMHAIC